MFRQLFDFRTSTGEKEIKFRCVDYKFGNIKPV